MRLPTHLTTWAAIRAGTCRTGGGLQRDAGGDENTDSVNLSFQRLPLLWVTDIHLMADVGWMDRDLKALKVRLKLTGRLAGRTLL